MNKYKPCVICEGRWKITLPIWRRARRRYARDLNKFQQWIAGFIKPKALKAQIDICRACSGSWLLLSDNFPEIDTNNYPHIAIIGGGIWGTAFAVACMHRWIPFTLYERDKSFDARSQWYWLTLQQASKAIAWLWIFELADGIISTNHIVHNPAGKVIGQWGRRNLSELELQKKTKPRNIHISRQTLRSDLISQLADERGIKWWHYLQNISHTQDWKIELELKVGDAKQFDQADLVVGADGIHSCVRSLLTYQIDSPLQYLWYIVILGICPLERLEGIESTLLDGKTVFQTVNGHERIYMMPYDQNSIMWQFSFPMSENDAKSLSKKWPQALKQEGIFRVWTWHTPIPEILNATDPSLISGYPVYDREIFEVEYFKNFWNITLLWDAMHPMSPFKWQGANQAILDALDLARGIATKCVPGSNWRDVWLREVVLKDFEKSMIERTTPKVYESAKQAVLLHSDAVMHNWDTPRTRGI